MSGPVADLTSDRRNIVSISFNPSSETDTHPDGVFITAPSRRSSAKISIENERTLRSCSVTLYSRRCFRNQISFAHGNPYFPSWATRYNGYPKDSIIVGSWESAFAFLSLRVSRRRCSACDSRKTNLSCHNGASSTHTQPPVVSGKASVFSVVNVAAGIG